MILWIVRVEGTFGYLHQAVQLASIGFQRRPCVNELPLQNGLKLGIFHNIGIHYVVESPKGIPGYLPSAEDQLPSNPSISV